MNKPVINVTELATMLGNGDKIVVADCRFDPSAPEAGNTAYSQGHIPGAHYLHLDNDLAGRVGETGGRHPVPSPDDFTALMRRIGVNADTLLVAYDGGGLAMASRLWWLARYFGHENAVVLNGGMAVWQGTGQPLESKTPVAAMGDFTAQANPTMRVDYEDLCDPGRRPLLIDSRDSSRYAGVDEPGGVPAGHIPGSVNKFYQEVFGVDGLLLDAEALLEHWSWLEQQQEPPVVSCGSGITACVNLLSMELAGLKGARLYPGSWSDWCQRGGEAATGDQ